MDWGRKTERSKKEFATPEGIHNGGQGEKTIMWKNVE